MKLRERATVIAEVLADYENNIMTPDHILGWVSQFEQEDRVFILDELIHIFKQTYLSKEKCKKILQSYLENWTKDFNYKDVASFITETAFLDLQDQHKSQKELLNLLDKILIEHYNCNLAQSGRRIKRYIYLDDVLCTGSKLFHDLDNWFKTDNCINPTVSNFQSVLVTQSPVFVIVVCGHTWGAGNTEFRLIKSLGTEVKKMFSIKAIYWIENNIKDYNPKLNNMIPLDNQDPYVHD